VDFIGIRVFMADNRFRKRDVRFKDAGRYRKKVVNWKPEKGKKYFKADQFKMKRRFDTPEGRSIYSKRMGTVEPVFGHLRGVLHPDRFTLRSKKKVNIQWLLYCMVHNIGKIQKYAGI